MQTLTASSDNTRNIPLAGARLLKQAVFTLVAWCSISAAQSTYGANVNFQDIEEVIVVAHQRPIPANAIGSSVSVLDTDDFSKRINFDPSALLRTLPSLNVSQTGPFGGLTQLRVRGSESNHTLVLIDGIESNDPANGVGFNLSTLAGTAINRIEVLRGPQSARYGADAIGGVIAIQTADFSASPSPAVSVGLESGSHGFHQGHINGGWQQATGNAQWRNRFSATRALTNGSNASFFGSESDGFRNHSMSAASALNWQNGDELGFSLRQTSGSADGDPQDFAFPATATQGLVIDGDESNATRQRLTALRGKMRTGAWLHEFMLSQNASRTRFRRDGVVDSGLRGRLNKADWTVSRELLTDDVSHTLNLGMQYEQRKFRNFSASLLNANHQASDQQRSQFFEYLVRDAQRSLSVSARHDNNQRFANLTTWRLTATQRLTAHARAHASWGEGSANPTFFELFGFIPDSFIGNADLKPEQSKGWDLGIDTRFCAGACRLDITYFRSRLGDEVTTTFEPPSFLARAINLQGVSRRDGWEIALGTNISGSFGIDAHWTRLDSKDPDGVIEVRRPRSSGGFNMHYAFAGERGKASASWIYQGEMHDNEFVAATPETRGAIKSVSLVNLGISFQSTSETTLFFRAQNTLDKQYQQVLGFKAPGVTASIGFIWSI